jgi:hypothetical protein
MKLKPIRRQHIAGRNVPCPCGSGKKHKRCCLRAIQSFAALPEAVREQIISDQFGKAAPPTVEDVEAVEAVEQVEEQPE